MIRLTVSLFSIVLLALACGSGDSTSEGGAPPVSAQAEQAAAPSAPGGAPAAASAEPDPQALGCLDLVSKERFQQAIAPCTAALRADPANAELKAALDRAQSATKSVADAQGAADAVAQGAADAAADSAKSHMDDATKSATDKMRY